MKISWLFLIFAAVLAAQPPIYDVLLKGGHVVDAKQNINDVRDVAIAQGKIAAVARDIPATQARRVVDVRSLYVTPGLVDMHVHLFNATNRETTPEHGIRPDVFSFRTGVTTVSGRKIPLFANRRELFKRRWRLWLAKIQSVHCRR